MRLSTASAVVMASSAAGAALEARKVCNGFDDVCGPWSLRVGGGEWTLSLECRTNNGGQHTSSIDLTKCIGNNDGQLVSGTDFQKTCDEYPAAHPVHEGGRNPLTVKCRDRNGQNVASDIQLHDILCDIDGVIRCQEQCNEHPELC